MSFSQVLQNIQQTIVANGVNAITADVLRPILESMLIQPNELIGDLSELETADQTSLVNAINEALQLLGEEQIPPVHITRLTFAELVDELNAGNLIKDHIYRSIGDGYYHFKGYSDPPNSADLVPIAPEIGQVDSVEGVLPIEVDNSDPVNPIVKLQELFQDLVNSALQPGDNVSELLNDAGYITADEELQGANQVYVEAKGTDVENAAELQAAYTTAQGMSPTADNRVTIICAAGYYSFASDFVMSTQYIDLVSIDGNRSIIFNGAGTINITANDVFVKGVNVLAKNFTIATDLDLLKLENCKGGDNSFAGGDGGIASGTFTNCQGGVYSFAGLDGIASGTFTNCQGGDGSFSGSDGTASGTFTDCVGGDLAFGGDGGIASGTFTNCQAGDNSFGSGADGTASGTFTNCQGGNVSFGTDGTASGTFTDCVGGNNSFGGGFNGIASGTFNKCIQDGVILVQIYTSNEINYRNFPASQFGTSLNPLTGNLTQNLASAARGQVQKIYHDDSVEPPYPATWRKAGEGEYLTNAGVDGKVNVIYVDFEKTGRQVYWIVQELL